MSAKFVLVTCETIAAVSLHARIVGDETPIKLGGHAVPRPMTLCGMSAAWDTRVPVAGVRCSACNAERERLEALAKGVKP